VSKKLHNKKKLRERDGRRWSFLLDLLFWVGKERLVVVVVSSFRDDGASETDRRRMSHNNERETRDAKSCYEERSSRERGKAASVEPTYLQSPLSLLPRLSASPSQSQEW